MHFSAKIMRTNQFVNRRKLSHCDEKIYFLAENRDDREMKKNTKSHEMQSLFMLKTQRNTHKIFYE